MSMALTQKMFRKHEKFVKKVLKLDLAQWNMIKTICLQHGGPFYEDNTYCGPGKLGDMLVPDLCFRFAGYVHDALVRYLRIAEERAFGIDKEFVDDVFKTIMLSICDQCSISGIFICDDVLPEMYHKAVDVFGKYDYDETIICKLHKAEAI